MRLDDALVHSGSQAEVVRIDNESPHGVSLAGKSARQAALVY
jgi:hypothetical protein